MFEVFKCFVRDVLAYLCFCWLSSGAAGSAPEQSLWLQVDAACAGDDR